MVMAGNSLNGNLKISEEVVVLIVKETIKESEGIYKLSNIPVGRKDYILKAKKPKPVVVEINGDTLKISVGIIVKNGQVIKTLTEHLQRAIKDAVQSMTGIAVYTVNIYVAGIKPIS